MRRDYDDPAYRRWRKAVYVRDRWKCRMPGCKGGDARLNAHHIRRWASYPSLRFVVANGITLCWTCHDRVNGVEEEFEALFLRLVSLPRTDAALRVLMLRYERRDPPEGG